MTEYAAAPKSKWQFWHVVRDDGRTLCGRNAQGWGRRPSTWEWEKPSHGYVCGTCWRMMEAELEKGGDARA